jgi:hypothetical protein
MNAKRMKPLLTNSRSSLLFSSQQQQEAWFKAIHKKAAYQGMIDEIRDEANRLQREPLLDMPFSAFTRFRDHGSRLEYENSYFKKRRRLTTFALMALIEPSQPHYLEQLQDTIWSICNEYTWCLPAHLTNSPEMDTTSQRIANQSTYTIDLFAAETAFTLSEVYQLTKNRLDPLIQTRILAEVDRRVLLPFLSKRSYEWETATHNWSAVCAGSIGCAAMHILKENEALATFLERVLCTLDCYLSGFNEDGVCQEGYHYWQYGFGYYTYFADLLKVKTKGAIDLFQSEKVHQIALFPQKCFLFEKKIANFSDALPVATIFMGLIHYLHNRYQDVEVPEARLRASYTEDHCSRFAPALRNLLWFDENISGQRWQNNSFYLKDSQWFISRKAPYAFACKGGHNDEPHNHNDVGHFILQAEGEAFLKDVGSGMYSDDYFGKERYTFLCNGSHGHSVPIINHQYQSAGKEQFATITNVEIGKTCDRLEMELQNAYQLESLQWLKRSFTWKKASEPGLTLVDQYQFTDDPKLITERFIAPNLPITITDSSIILEGKRRLQIRYDQQLLEWTVKKHRFINHFGEEESVQLFDFTVREPKRCFDVLFAFEFLH